MRSRRSKYLIRWLVCVAVVAAASGIFPYSVHAAGPVTLVLAGTMLWLMNLLVRPLLQLIALPLTVVTLGLFSLVVNAGMVRLTDVLMPSLRIRGFGMCLLIALGVSLGNMLTAARERDGKN